ncbi:Ste24p [Sugiyamaella lignohabitans]|uniref:CAAX prenyl protease n=1 Tax=Sugiyamaella lignohabitans TaxID=796027 RepID=A0A167F073_9ASCO|nr:Ste24p [Sugiyamaella lignohabitans]ANB14661.1 Ste24p [Sugiyamaella lignohabitans]
MGFTAGQYLFTTYLSYRQYQVLKKPSPPKELDNVITQETFKKTQEYGRAKAKFGFFTSFFSFVQNVAILKYDLLPKMFGLAGKFLAAYGHSKWFSGLTAQSIVFLLGFQFVETIISLPLSLYSDFVIEERFGFNKQTIGLFFTDLVKSEILKIVIGAPLIAAILKIIDYFGDQFFFYLWLFMVGFQVVAIAVFPTLIQPLFNKLSPLEDGELKTSVENLAKRVQFPLNKLYVIDGSKRSSHSNAYFYGLPWSKQIVIFDTLIEKSTVDEVTAVLAHEIGHWALSHTTKMLLVAQAHLFAIFALFSAFIRNQSLYNSFGFFSSSSQYPILVGFILFGDILQPLESLLSFAMNLMSRSFEFQADDYAVNLNYGPELSKSLIGIHTENLSNVDADWLYSSYHHSHPILPERLKALRLATEAIQKKKH